MNPPNGTFLLLDCKHRKRLRILLWVCSLLARAILNLESVHYSFDFIFGFFGSVGSI